MRSIYDNTKVGGVIAVYGSLTGVVATGDGVDTKGYNSAALRVQTSAVGAGIPVNTGASLVAVLEESADNVTFSAANDNTGTQIGVTITATTTAVVASARIEGLNQNRLRYLRAKITTKMQVAPLTPAKIFTGVAVIVMGRAYALPTDTTTSNT